MEDIWLLEDLWKLVVHGRRKALAGWKGSTNEDPDPLKDERDAEKEDHTPVLRGY